MLHTSVNLPQGRMKPKSIRSGWDVSASLLAVLVEVEMGLIGTIQNFDYLYELVIDRRSGTGNDTGIMRVLRNEDSHESFSPARDK